jgi:hypothetical protein
LRIISFEAIQAIGRRNLKLLGITKIIIYSLTIVFFLAQDNLLTAEDSAGNATSERKTCETNEGLHCSHFKCSKIPASFEQYARSSQGKEIVAALSKVNNSENFSDTIHEDEKLLKAISLFLQIPGIGDLSEEKMECLFSYFRGKADWEDSMSVWAQIKRVKNNIYLIGVSFAATTQPGSLYIFYDSAYKRIAKGEGGSSSVIDFRLRGDELGVIFCRTPGSTHPESDFALLKRENDKWLVVWNSVREREWIAADGQIEYLADDLSLIRVRGSYYGLGRVDEKVRFTILEDIDRQHIGRQFTGIWERKGDAYVRKSKLPQDAPLYDRLLEMTD